MPTHIHEQLGSAEVVTPGLSAALAAAQMYDMASRMLVYHCATCTGQLDEATGDAYAAASVPSRSGVIALAPGV